MSTWGREGTGKGRGRVELFEESREDRLPGEPLPESQPERRRERPLRFLKLPVGYVPEPEAQVEVRRGRPTPVTPLSSESSPSPWVTGFVTVWGVFGRQGGSY